MADETYDNGPSGNWDGHWGGRSGGWEGPWSSRGGSWEGPWGGRGRGFFRGGRGRGMCPFRETHRDFMDFYAPDFDFQYQESEHEHPSHSHHHPFHRHGRGHHSWFPRHHGFEGHPFFRPGHHLFGRRDNHAFTVDVYPFEAKNTDIKIEDKKLVITSKNNRDTRQTVQTFKLPEHSNAETWKVDQETTDTTVILMTRNKTKD